MSVYIASMNLRGIRASTPEHCKSLNVTSAQAKTSQDRLAFSPMTPIPGGYRGYWCFENYWQAGKVYDGLDWEESREWMKSQTVPRRRFPGGKDKSVLCCLWDYEGVENAEMDYVLSRKYIYVPEYTQLTQSRASDRIQYWKNYLKSKTEPEGFSETTGDVVIYDFDGPRDEHKNPTCKRLTLELLREK